MASPQTSTTKILRLTVVSALDLAKKDIFGASDPYVQIYKESFDTANDPTNKIRKTSVKKKTLNPVWGETFEFEVDPRLHVVVLDVMDANKITRDDFLGRVKIKLHG